MNDYGTVYPCVAFYSSGRSVCVCHSSFLVGWLVGWLVAWYLLLLLLLALCVVDHGCCLLRAERRQCPHWWSELLVCRFAHARLC